MFGKLGLKELRINAPSDAVSEEDHHGVHAARLDQISHTVESRALQEAAGPSPVLDLLEDLVTLGLAPLLKVRSWSCRE